MNDQEINEAVARKLGWIPPTMAKWEQNEHLGEGRPLKHLRWHKKEEYSEVEKLPDYCHDIKAAWEVVEYLRKTNTDMRLVYHPPYGSTESWSCELEAQNFSESADSAPMAICLAFLKLEEKP